MAGEVGRHGGTPYVGGGTQSRWYWCPEHPAWTKRVREEREKRERAYRVWPTVGDAILSGQLLAIEGTSLAIRLARLLELSFGR